MLYWNLERELVDGEPLFFGQNKQFQDITPPKSTKNNVYSEIFAKIELTKVSSAASQRENRPPA